MANGNRVKELLELEKAGKLTPNEKNAVEGLRSRGEFPPALVPTQAETQVAPATPAAAPAEQSWGRWAAEEALPTAGSAVGAGLGALTSPFTGPIGPMVGAGLGAAGGRALNPAAFKLFGAEPPKPYTMGELATEGAFGAAGEGAGRAVYKIGKAGMGLLLPEPAPASTAGTLREAFGATGVTPKPSDVSPSRGLAMTERALYQTPAQGTIYNRVTQQGAQLGEAGESFLGKLGPAAERGPAGEAVTEAIEKNVDKWRKAESDLWERAITPRAKGQRIDARRFQMAARRILEIEMNMAPGQRNEALIQTLKAIGEEGDVVQYEKLRSWQQGFGRSLAGTKGLVSNLPEAESKYMYEEALTAIEQGLSHDPALAASFKRAREVSREGNELFRARNLRNVTDADPEKVMGMIQGTGGPSSIIRAKRAILGDPNLGGAATPTPEDQLAWDTARRHILEGILGGAQKEIAGQPEKVLVGSALEKNINRVGRDTLKELLSPDEIKALDQLTLVAKAIRKGERVGAAPWTSSTAGALGMQGLLTGTGAAIGGLMGGGIAGGAAGAVAANVLAPQALARLVTSPGVAKMILSPKYAAVLKQLQTGGKVTGEGIKLLGRLGGIAAGKSAVEEGREEEE